MDEGVGAGDDAQQDGPPDDGAGLVGPAPPAVPADGLGQGGGLGVEAVDLAPPALVDVGGLAGREDEGAGGEAERQRRGQHAVDPGRGAGAVEVGGREGGQPPEVDRHVGRQVGGVRREQGHAVDGAGEERGQEGDRPVGDDLGVGRAARVRVRAGERAQEPERHVG